MNKVIVTGWVYKTEYQKLEHCGAYVRFKLKTEKTIGLKRKSEKVNEYYYIDCDMKGNKAQGFYNNVKEGQKILLTAQLNLKKDNILTLAVEEIDFL